ncbi:hypothetical protein Tco_1118943, partial [Tanacetum coccineum]
MVIVTLRWWRGCSDGSDVGAAVVVTMMTSSGGDVAVMMMWWFGDGEGRCGGSGVRRGGGR